MKRVLSIDGGGIRGLLPAMLLQALEARERKPAAAMFDLIAGTSTGGIIAVGACSGLVSASKMVELYRDKGPSIFGRSLERDVASGHGFYGAKYAADVLERELGALLGSRPLSSVKSPELLVPTYVTQLPAAMDVDGDGIAELASSWFFKSWKARADKAYDFMLWDVARATSAAPTYFPAADIQAADGRAYTCIDGGVFANNPALCALAAAKQLWPGELVKIVSLGTGTKSQAVAAGDWGYAQWATRIASVFMDGAADTVSYAALALLGPSGFTRCEMAVMPPVDESFDDASPENIAALVAMGDAYVKKFLPLL